MDEGRLCVYYSVRTRLYLSEVSARHTCARAMDFTDTVSYGHTVPSTQLRVVTGLLHVWEAELHDRWFSRASRELGVPLTAARGIATSAHPDSCTRALCAGAGIQVRRQTGNALERGRYTGFANRLPGAGMAGAR
jgi:hypothetical protein